MVPGFHGLDLIVILVIALLIFGPKKLPEMGSAIGKSIKEFRKGMHELTGHKDEEFKMPGEYKMPSTFNFEAIERDLAIRRTVSADVPLSEGRTVSADVPLSEEGAEPKSTEPKGNE
ncbi:MAG: twin-arginine translocase TatA/TatE family subunit [Ktedonobacteraceae bacterium]|nr:twin-arginine translocase TatA/TatE family subunit [Ktedonobacteraceae bacterium]